MNTLTLDDLLNLVKSYNPEEVENVRRAYYYAARLHEGQKRQSGEDYIIHPLNVCYILASIHVDGCTLCAGLLHDTLEDTHVTKEQIAHDFNPTIANLVDGVTNLNKIDFSSKEEVMLANIRKVLMGMVVDVRSILIKIADVLHNMRTLEFKSQAKQIEKSIITRDIYVPVSDNLGLYKIKTELEDLAFRFLKPDLYKKIAIQKEQIECDNIKLLDSMSDNIKTSLYNKNIECDINKRTKNIYGIYKKLQEGEKPTTMSDLLAIKILVNEIEECYISLGIIHSLYRPINNKFKDYIAYPKTNMYSSLHSTVLVPNSDRLVQTQIRTYEMDKRNSIGIASYFDKNKGKAIDIMQKEIREFPFFDLLLQINSLYPDNTEFIDQVKKELFGKKIYVISSSGNTVELSENSTVIDYAYINNKEEANSMIGAYVNGVFVLPNTVLKNQDRVTIVTNDLYWGPRNEWEDTATNSYVKKMIRDYKTELTS